MVVLEKVIKYVSDFFSRTDVDRNDICFLGCGVFIILGLINPWFLCIAFVSLLPVLSDQLELSTVKNSKQFLKDQDVNRDTTETLSENNTKHDSTIQESQQQKTNISLKTSPISQKESKKPVEFRSSRDNWGIPMVHITGESGRTIEVNAQQPVPIESKYFKGVILPMIRCDGEYEKYNRYSNYFSGKQRRFEVQFQVILSLSRVSRVGYHDCHS